jgi:hypothetical protein
MNASCPVSISELNNDLVQARLDTAFRYSSGEQRAEVFALANDYLKSAEKINDCWGREYPLRELMVTVWDHELYEKAFIAQANGNPNPMSDLILRCARYACAVYLFGEEKADDLGYSL